MSRKFKQHRRLKPVRMFESAPIAAQNSKIYEEMEEMQTEYANVMRKLQAHELRRDELKRLELELLDVSGAAQMMVYLLNKYIGCNFGLSDDEVFEDLVNKNEARGYYDPPQLQSAVAKADGIADIPVPKAEVKSPFNMFMKFFTNKE